MVALQPISITSTINKCYNCAIMMTYNQYLHLMFSLETFYDFHPEYFRELSNDKQNALSKVFLYDYDDTHNNDDDYPKSIEGYFRDNIENNQRLQQLALSAVSDIYRSSGMGEFSLTKISKEAP